MNLRNIWRRITTSQRTREASAQRECALKEEFARRTHALESQILLLRAENRALLNSVLGVAGIPPIMVTDPPASPSHGRHSEERRDEESLFVSPDCLGAEPKRDPSGLKSSPQDDGEMGDSVMPSGAASPSAIAGHNSAVPLRKRYRHAAAGNDGRIVAPMRRRSWHQIYRMLEFESSRRKAQDS
jgi:hypothetical protein